MRRSRVWIKGKRTGFIVVVFVNIDIAIGLLDGYRAIGSLYRGNR